MTDGRRTLDFVIKCCGRLGPSAVIGTLLTVSNFRKRKANCGQTVYGHIWESCYQPHRLRDLHGPLPEDCSYPYWSPLDGSVGLLPGLSWPVGVVRELRRG